MSTVKGTIFARTGGREYEFEMHSFVKNFLRLLNAELAAYKEGDLAHFARGISISTETAPSYTVNTSSSFETSIFSNYNNTFLTSVYSKDINGNKSLTIKKVFKNISNESKTIQTVMLHTCDSAALYYPLIVDSVNVVVDAGQTVEITYVLDFSKNFSEGFVFSLDRRTGGYERTTKNVGGNSFVAGTNIGVGLSMTVGSSSAAVNGSEYNLRSPLSLTASTLVKSIIDPAGGDKGRFRAVGTFSNSTGSSVTINEVALTGMSNQAYALWIIKVLDSPVVLAPGEMAELTIDIVLE